MKYGLLQHEEPFIRSAVNESPLSPKQLPRTQLLPGNGNASIAPNPNFPNQSMMQQKRKDSFQAYPGAGGALGNAASIGAAMLD